MIILQKLLSFKSDRSSRLTKHILLSLIAKGIGILCSLVIVPLTINYVNPSSYGVWLTVSSIVAWIAFFDLGLANGFRNKFAEAQAKGNVQLAREYLSTTYFTMGVICGALILTILIVNLFLDWSSILNVAEEMRGDLRIIFGILSVFFCLNLVANVFSVLLTANQQPGYAALINCLGQIVSLVVIIILTNTTEGSLLNLAIYYAGIPCIVMIICSVFAFTFTRYKQFSPTIRMVKVSLIRDIIGKGLQFFTIYLCLILIFQMSNVVLSREIGPVSVTQYNIAYKYFSVLNMIMAIIVTPFWSAFTDAYAKSDYSWMKGAIKKLEHILVIAIVVAALMLLVSGFVYKIWIKDSVIIPLALSISMALYMISRSFGDIYMYAINGIGTIRIQLIAYLVFAIIAWPCLVWACRFFGVYGVVVFPSLVYVVQGIIGKIQLSKIISGRADGIWLK